VAICTRLYTGQTLDTLVPSRALLVDMTHQPELWIGMVELRPLKRPASEPAGAFTNIVTWARDKAEFRTKAEIIAAEFEMYSVEIEDEEPVEQRLKNHSIDEKVEDPIERATLNPDAILYGSFHSYMNDDA